MIFSWTLTVALRYATLHLNGHYVVITLPYLTLPYMTLHYISLHYITLHHITSHYITWTLHNRRITLWYIPCHGTRVIVSSRVVSSCLLRYGFQPISTVRNVTLYVLVSHLCTTITRITSHRCSLRCVTSCYAIICCTYNIMRSEHWCLDV